MAWKRFGLILPFLQTFSPAQYSPSSQTFLQDFALGLLQVFSPVLEDSLQTLLVFLWEQSEVERQGTRIVVIQSLPSLQIVHMNKITFRFFLWFTFLPRITKFCVLAFSRARISTFTYFNPSSNYFYTHWFARRRLTVRIKRTVD